MNDNSKNQNFWIIGRNEQKKFYDIKLTTKTNIITFIGGLLLGAIIILPFGLMVFQYIQIYNYKAIFSFYILLIWILLMLFNGLSNYFTLKLAQAYNKDMDSLQEIKAKYIFYYQILNIGFGIFSLIVIIFFGLGILSRM